MTTKLSASNFQPNALGAITGPRISNVQVTDSTYTVLDDTAVDTAGGYIKITGTNFVAGCQVVVDMTAVTAVTFVSATEVTAQLAAKAAGTYTVYVINPNGDTAVRIYGVTFSAAPAWVTESTLIGDSGTVISIQLVATDASTYALAAGSTLPAGLSLSSSGLISGTVDINEETLYNFTVVATDAELQDSPRSFSITITVGDPQIAYVTALLSPDLEVLPFNDDASTNNFAVSIFGDTRPNNFGPYTPGYYSNFFDGTGDFLTAQSMTLGTSAFTIEFWAYPTSIPTNAIIFGTTTNGGIQLQTSGGNMGVGTYGVGGNTITTSGSPFVANRWLHIVVVRSGTGANQTSIFFNGVRDGNGTVSTNYVAGPATIGGAASQMFFGYISNFRVVIGTAVYDPTQTTLTVPTQPLTAIANTNLLTCQSNRFIDNSTNNFAITRNGDVRIDGFDPFVIPAEFAGRGSTYFDGTGDYLTVPDNTSFDFTGDFTMEAWVYPNAISANNGIVSQWSSGLNFIFKIVTSGRPYFAAYPGSTVVTQGTTTAVVVNTWNHIAVTRSGSTIRLFVNGILDTTTGTVSGTISGGNPVTIGSVGTAEYLNGYISNLRLIKGTALYTADFTPPTAPLTAVANTSLLTCQTNQPVNNNTFLDSSTNNFLITRNGNTTQGTSSPYGGGWSNYFDGTGDNLTVTTTALTGTWTIEFWAYHTAAGGAEGVGYFFNGNTGSNANRIQFGRDPSGAAYFYSEATSLTNYAVSSAANVIALNTWYHIAVVSNSSTIKIHVNGVEVATGSITNTPASGTSLNIGFLRSASALQYFAGYISNFRYTRTAVYTANFTPPTAPLQPIVGTSLLTCADNRLVDDSPNNFVVTRTGDVSVQKFNPFGIQTAATPVSYSGYFDGTGDYLSFANSVVAATGDFTIEGWINIDAVGTRRDIFYQNVTSGSTEGRLIINVNTTGTLSAFVGGTGAPGEIQSSTVVQPNVWYHFAYVRNSNTFSLYVNGVQEGTQPTSTISIANQPLLIGYNPVQVPATYWKGYISNIRVVNGSAVYTANFTPSTAPLTAIAGTSLLTCQSPTFVDNSTNRSGITAAGDARPSQTNPFGFTAGAKTSYTPQVYGGSMYFDGTGDFLTVPDNTQFRIGTNSFTIDLWLYKTTNSTAQSIVSIGPNSAAGFGLIFFSSLARLRFGVGGSGNAIVSDTQDFPLFQWTHVALVRNGTQLTLFINGGSRATTTWSTSWNPSGGQVTSIGQWVDGTSFRYGPGYIADLRVINGTALYTSSFAPPTSPLTPIINTTLLVNGTGAAVRDASMGNNLETVGDAKSSTSVVKYGSTSMAFDGNGDRLIIPYTPALSQVGPYTLEFWFYPTYNFNQQYLFARNAGGYFGLEWNGTTGIIRVDKHGVGIQITATTALGLNQWHHVAMTYDGTTTRLFTNGILQGSVSGTGGESSANTTIGYYEANTSSSYGGYMSDFRFTRGVARYTANFTPPAAPLKTK